MSPKWSFSVLIAILTLFGVQQSQIMLPNQEIVVEFTDADITSDEAHNAIAEVKSQLQLLGADNIQVQEGIDGILKISYYSDTDVASIRKNLSDNTVKLDYTDHKQDNESTNLPFSKNTKTYDLDVYEIIDASNTDWDFEGVSVVELKSENHRFFNPNVYVSTDEIHDKERTTKTALKANIDIAIAIDNWSFKIPETRAGPFA